VIVLIYPSDEIALELKCCILSNRIWKMNTVTIFNNVPQMVTVSPTTWEQWCQHILDTHQVIILEKDTNIYFYREINNHATVLLLKGTEVIKLNEMISKSLMGDDANVVQDMQGHMPYPLLVDRVYAIYDDYQDTWLGGPCDPVEFTLQQQR
jgi:hypothetical protein